MSRLTPAHMAELAAQIQRHGIRVDEIWLLPALGSPLWEQARRDWTPEGWKVASQIPKGYEVLIGREHEQFAILIGHDHHHLYNRFRIGGWTPITPTMLEQIGTYDSEPGPDGFTRRERLRAVYLWWRYWSLTSKVARRRQYAQIVDEHQRRATTLREVPGIVVVRWRGEDEKARRTGTGKTVYYTHRWPVVGHLRRRRTGRVEVVRGYVKGPAGLPLIEPVRVNRLVR